VAGALVEKLPLLFTSNVCLLTANLFYFSSEKKELLQYKKKTKGMLVNGKLQGISLEFSAISTVFRRVQIRMGALGECAQTAYTLVFVGLYLLQLCP
jgi:hypothetical protein